MGGWWLVLLTVAVAVPVWAILYHVLIRPWHLRWGTVGDETTRPLPGDDFASRDGSSTTHAISINGAAKDVWPWLVQMGQGRGGFYSYTWLENLVGCRMKNANQIVPEWQQLEVGDDISLHPKAQPLKVIAIEKDRVLALGGRSGKGSKDKEGHDDSQQGGQSVFSWAFVLNDRSEDQTRLIVRAKGQLGTGWMAALLNYIIGEPAHFIMERRMLMGIKRRVESRRRDH